MKMKREEGEGRIAFAARVVNAVVSGGAPQPVDELYAAIDKRCRRSKTTKARFSANLSDAARKYELIHVMKNNGMWPKLKSNSPLFFPLDGGGLFRDEEATVEKDAPTEKVIKTVKPSRALLENCSVGQLLKFKYGLDKDDVMSVVEDLLYDRPYAEVADSDILEHFVPNGNNLYDLVTESDKV
mgnify:CR=1 FL=1